MQTLVPIKMKAFLSSKRVSERGISTIEICALLFKQTGNPSMVSLQDYSLQVRISKSPSFQIAPLALRLFSCETRKVDLWQVYGYSIQLEHPFKARINVAELTWYYSWSKKEPLQGTKTGILPWGVTFEVDRRKQSIWFLILVGNVNSSFYRPMEVLNKGFYLSIHNATAKPTSHAPGS